MGGGPEEVEGHSVICSGALVAMASGVYVENKIKICPFFQHWKPGEDNVLSRLRQLLANYSLAYNMWVRKNGKKVETQK